MCRVVNIQRRWDQLKPLKFWFSTIVSKSSQFTKPFRNAGEKTTKVIRATNPGIRYEAILAVLLIDNPCAGPSDAVFTIASLCHVIALLLHSYSDSVILRAVRLLDSVGPLRPFCLGPLARAPGQRGLLPGSDQREGIPEILCLLLRGRLVRRGQRPNNNAPLDWRDRCARQDDSSVSLRQTSPVAKIFALDDREAARLRGQEA